MAKKGMLGGILLFIGAILLIVALLTSWYTTSLQSSGPGGSATEQLDFKPGSSYSVSFSCSGAASSLCPGSTTCSYSGSSSNYCNPQGINRTGQLYAVTEYLVIGGLVLGLLAGIFAMMSGGKPGMRKGAIALGVIALLFALVVPITLLAAQPGALKSDFTPSGGSAPTGNGPYSSFFGSCSGNNCGFTGPASGNVSDTWGPSVGWYLSIVAFIVFLLGTMMVMRSGKESAPMAAPMPAQPASMDNPGAPMTPPGNPPT